MIKMSSLTKSGRRKRESQADREFRQKKRVCLENFFTELVSPDAILNKFTNEIEELENEDINLAKLTNISNYIKQLKQRDLIKHLKAGDVMKVIKNLTNFIKVGFIKDFQSSYEWNLLKWKSNVEVTFEASLICLSLLSSEWVVEGENIDVHVNDIIFFLRKVFDDINTQLTRVRDVKRINSVPLKELLLDNLSVVNEVIKLRNLNSLNVTGLITSFIQTVLYHKDTEVQTSALLSIVSFYRKGEEFRALVLNLTLKSLERVYEHYKFRRNYCINSSSSVSFFTVLIMALVENVPVLGFYTYESCNVSIMQNNQNLLSESFENVMKVTCFIIKTFIQKMETNSEGSKMYNIFFGHLVAELIQVSNEPEWPSAKLILNLLLKPLTEIITLKPPTETPLKIFAVKALSEIIKQKITDKIVYEEILESLNQKFTNLDEECDFTEFTQRLMVHRMKKLNKTELNANHVLLHAIQWFDNLKHKPNFEGKVSNLRKLVTGYDSSEIADINEKETRAVLYYLDTVRRNYADCNVILKYVLCCYYDKNRKVKYSATQYIFDMINLDSGLLSQSMVANIVRENLLFSPAVLKERLWAVIDKHLTIHPEKCEEYAPLLLRLLDVQSDRMRKMCIESVLKIIKTQQNIDCKTQFCYKILTKIQNHDSEVQKRVFDFCTKLWLDDGEENVNVLLGIVEMPNAPKYLRFFFEEKLKPPLNDRQFQTQTEPCRNLAKLILDKIGRDERTLPCLRIISILVTASPKTFVPDLFVIAGPLTRSEYTNDYAVEILTAEILNCILPEDVNPDVLNYITLRSALVDKIMSKDGLNYTMGLIVSLLKLVNNLSKFDSMYLGENCFHPSMHVLREYSIVQNTSDNRIVSRALCIAVYLHIYFMDETQNFYPILNFFIEHKIFGLTTIHCLCYLSMDYKSIMSSEPVKKTIAKYLEDKRYPVLLRAVLYNIMCSLKNIYGGQWSRKEDSIEPVKNLIQKHIADLLDCITDNRSEIRRVAYGVIRQLLKSGLIPESRLVPSILLMSTDPVDDLSQVAIELLHQMEKKHLTDFMRDTAKCVIASMVFNLKCLKQDFIRGYVNRKGQMEAKCNHFYVLQREDLSMRRRIIDSIIKGISPEGETTAIEKFYLAENLAFFTYKYQEEVYYVLCQIETVLMTVPIPDVPDDLRERRSYICKYYGLYILTHVKYSLMYYYGFTGDKLCKYYQDDEKRDLVQTKKYSVYEIPKNSLPNAEDVQILCENIFSAVKNQQKRYVHT